MGHSRWLMEFRNFNTHKNMSPPRPPISTVSRLEHLSKSIDHERKQNLLYIYITTEDQLLNNVEEDPSQDIKIGGAR